MIDCKPFGASSINFTTSSNLLLLYLNTFSEETKLFLGIYLRNSGEKEKKTNAICVSLPVKNLLFWENTCECVERCSFEVNWKIV